MKLPDILKTKTLKFTAVTIVLGAIGSGVWEWLLKPALAGSTDFLLSVGTLGVKTFKDSVYADIARGLHEDASLRLLSLVLSVGPGFVTGLFMVLLVALHRVKAEKEALPSVSHRLLTGVSISMVVFLLAFSLIQTVRISYVNRAATHFNQLLNIAARISRTLNASYIDPGLHRSSRARITHLLCTLWTKFAAKISFAPQSLMCGRPLAAWDALTADSSMRRRLVFAAS